MKIIKIAAIILLSLGAAILAIFGYVAATFDSARLKQEAAKAVQEKYQRKLAIDGEMALSFWPQIGVRLGKATLSEPASDKEFAAIEKARIAVAVLPLLSKQVAVNAIELDGLRATLIKRKDGTLNIADLAGGGSDRPPPEQPAGKTESPPIKVDIGGIRITNAQLTWRDEVSGQSTVISGLDVATGAIVADTGRQTLSVDGVNVSARGKTGDDDFEVRADVPKLAVAAGRANGERVLLSAKLAGKERNIAARLAVNGFEGGAEAIKVGKIELEAEARAADADVKARIDTSLSADLAKKMFALDKIAGTVDIAHPRMPMKSVKLPIDGQLRADLGKQSAAGALATRFDESSIALKFDLARFSPPSLGFDLDIDRLNLDKYLPPAKPGEEKKGAGGGAAAEARIDLSALKGLDLRGTVTVGELQVSRVKASKIRLQVNAANGRLEVSPHSMNLYDGTLAGSLAVNAADNSVALREDLRNISVNPLLRDLADKDLVEGRGNVRLDVSTRGSTVTAMKKALAGSASVALHDGALKGINLAQAFRELKAALSARQDAVQQARQTDKTDFSELTASFRIGNGVAHNDDLAAKSPFLRLAGAGDIDIGNGSMNYVAKASVVATSGGQGARELEYLKGITVPVRVTGPFDHLTYKLEVSALATEAVKAKVEEKKQELQQKAKEQLFKGLFGR